MKLRWLKNKQLGMTLIEVIIAIFLVGSMLVLYAAALQTVYISKKLKYENIAYHIANKKMEELRETPYVSLPSSGSISDSLLTSIPSGAGTYTVLDYPSFSGLKEFTVTVTWNDGNAKQVQLKSLSGSGGINP